MATDCGCDNLIIWLQVKPTYSNCKCIAVTKHIPVTIIFIVIVIVLVSINTISSTSSSPPSLVSS